jgi:hypothetical protein
MESCKIPDADDEFGNAPIFNFNDDKLKFSTNNVSYTGERYGSVSGFLPKYLVSTKGILNWDTFCITY